MSITITLTDKPPVATVTITLTDAETGALTASVANVPADNRDRTFALGVLSLCQRRLDEAIETASRSDADLDAKQAAYAAEIEAQKLKRPSLVVVTDGKSAEPVKIGPAVKAEVVPDVTAAPVNDTNDATG